MHVRVLGRGEHLAQRGHRHRGRDHGPRDGTQLRDGPRRRQLQVPGATVHHGPVVFYHEMVSAWCFRILTPF